MNTEKRIFAANLDSLEPMADFITDRCAAAGLDKKKCYAISLAVDEIATNIINYGYAAKKTAGNEIEMTINTDEQHLTLTLEDSAMEFDPLKHVVPSDEHLNKPLEERQIGGLGILLAIKNVDSFKYEYTGSKNKNIFTMNLHRS